MDTDKKPTACAECGAPLRAAGRDATPSLGYSKPTRVDWTFTCSRDPQHPAVQWTELPPQP